MKAAVGASRLRSTLGCDPLPMRSACMTLAHMSTRRAHAKPPVTASVRPCTDYAGAESRALQWAHDASTCFMNHGAHFRTALVLLLCIGGAARPPSAAASAAAERSESDERRLSMGRDAPSADYRCERDDAVGRPAPESALSDGLSPMDEFDDALRKDLMREKKHDKERRGPKIWDQWGKWSACSVTCGVGKIVRWRHCVAGGCAPGEKEAQIKSCTLPAC